LFGLKICLSPDIRRTIETDPDVPKWNLIMDCLNTHQSESLVRLVGRCWFTVWKTFRWKLHNSPYLAYSNWKILNSYLYSATPVWLQKKKVWILTWVWREKVVSWNQWNLVLLFCVTLHTESFSIIHRNILRGSIKLRFGSVFWCANYSEEQVVSVARIWKIESCILSTTLIKQWLNLLSGHIRAKFWLFNGLLISAALY